MNAPTPPQQPPRIPKGAVQSFDSRKLQSKARVSALRLGPAERSELEYLWHQYESDLGCKSLHTSVGARLLRAPPNDRVKGLVIAELERLGRADRSKLIDVIVLEGQATHYELRRAVDALVASGKVEQREGGVLAMTGRVVRQRTRRDPDVADRARWQAQDASLEAFCATMTVHDYESPVHTDIEPPKKPVAKSLAALASIAPRHALALRRFYGERDPSCRYDAFGELAPLVEMTPRLLEERAKRVAALVETRLEHAMGEATRMQREWETKLETTETRLERARKVNAAAKATGRETAKALRGLGKAAQAHHNARVSEPGTFDQARTERDIRRAAEREVTTIAVLRELLDTPKSAGRAAFVREVLVEAEQVLVAACCAYRKARRGT